MRKLGYSSKCKAEEAHLASWRIGMSYSVVVAAAGKDGVNQRDCVDVVVPDINERIDEQVRASIQSRGTAAGGDSNVLAGGTSWVALMQRSITVKWGSWFAECEAQSPEKIGEENDACISQITESYNDGTLMGKPLP